MLCFSLCLGSDVIVVFSFPVTNRDLSDASGTTVADGDSSAIDNHRDFAGAAGDFQHFFQQAVVPGDITVFDGKALSGVIPAGV